MSTPYSIQDVDVDPRNWTPVVTPFGCRNVGVRNTFAADLEITTGRSRTVVDTIAPAAQETAHQPDCGASSLLAPDYWLAASVSGEGALVTYFQT